MNRTEERKIAEIITNDQIKEMFKSAKLGIKNWEKTSTVNKGLTKGLAWNILAKDFDININYHILAKTNMVREFSEYLPFELLPEKKKKRQINKVSHQSPDFSNW